MHKYIYLYTLSYKMKLKERLKQKEFINSNMMVLLALKKCLLLKGEKQYC